MRDPFAYTWWLASRSAGIVAFILLGVVTLLGLASALKLVSRPTSARLRPWHERLALTAMICLLAHGLLLFFDPWLHPGALGLIVPFTMSYRPLWTGLGLIAAYLTAGFGLSFYARRRVGARRWRSAHRFAPVAFLLGCAHALGAGTDARSPLLLGIIVAFASAVVAMTFARLVGSAWLSPPPPRPRPRSARPAATRDQR